MTPSDREQVLLAVSGGGVVTLDGERHPARAGDASTVPAGAGRPLALPAVEAYPGSPRRRSGPQRLAQPTQLCVGAPPDADVWARNLSREQPLLLASIEMGEPA
jgi:hypothetical protein